MKALSSVVLPDTVIVPAPKTSQLVKQSIEHTVAGNPIVYEKALYGGRPIQLQFTEDYCWLSATQVDELIALADVIGMEYLLTWGTVITPVRFDHSSGPAASFDEVLPDSGRYIGTIKLITSR